MSPPDQKASGPFWILAGKIVIVFGDCGLLSDPQSKNENNKFGVCVCMHTQMCEKYLLFWQCVNTLQPKVTRTTPVVDQAGFITCYSMG